MTMLETHFYSCDDKLAANLFIPDEFDSSNKYPAIVVAGPMATVKEQAAGVFAQALADRGFIGLAFDYRRFGDSKDLHGSMKTRPPKQRTFKMPSAFFARMTVSVVTKLEQLESAQVPRT